MTFPFLRIERQNTQCPFPSLSSDFIEDLLTKGLQGVVIDCQTIFGSTLPWPVEGSRYLTRSRYQGGRKLEFPVRLIFFHVLP